VKVLIACEFSGVVREAFRKRGHDAWSCDLLEAADNSRHHLQMDALEAVELGWDLLIAHPPCTYLTCAQNKWMLPKYADRFPNRLQDQEAAVKFFLSFTNVRICKVCIENPVGVMSSRYRRPNQIIQPWQFGHPDRKSTCLWLKGLSKLVSTNIVEPRIKINRNGKTASVHHDAALRLPPEERWRARSITYQGWADAMADQWG
jgi:hypothetical protein